MRRTMLILPGIILSQFLIACTADTPPVQSPPNDPAPAIVQSEYLKPSHDLQNVPLHIEWTRFKHFGTRRNINTVTFEDFDNDGDKDVFVTYFENAPTSSCSPGDAYCHKPTEPRVYENVGNNYEHTDDSGSFRARPLHGFALNTQKFFAGEVPQLINVRKALTGDYNGDGRPDLFLATHGPAVPPLERETAPTLLLSTKNGFIQSDNVKNYTGYHHGAASADIDNDGDLDVIISDPTPYFLLNDGRGNFRKTTRGIPTYLISKSIWTVELADVDNDNNIDLIVRDLESSVMIYWGQGNGYFRNKTRLPADNKFGTVLDIDVGDLNGDGHNDIVITRTQKEPYYQGYSVQVVIGNDNRKFRNAQNINHESARWIRWIQLIDVNKDGHLDIVQQDNNSGKLKLINDGNGQFI